VDLPQAKLELTDLAHFPDNDFQRVVCYYVILGPDLSLQVKQKYQQSSKNPKEEGKYR
jgi:hypothetical protein